MNATSEKIEINGQTIELFCLESGNQVEFTANIVLADTPLHLVFKPWRFAQNHDKDVVKFLIGKKVMNDLKILTRPIEWGVRIWPKGWTLKLNPNGEFSKIELWEN